MNSNPLITIIVPVHNREGLLPATLESVRVQTYTDWECIVVDDHSTDGSLAIAQYYTELDTRFKVAALPETKRYANAARNYGISLAKGDFVNFLDSDDLFHPKKLEVQVAQFQISPELDVVTCQSGTFKDNPDVDLMKPYVAPLSHALEYIFEGQTRGYFSNTIAPIWKKKALLEINCWDEDNPGGAWQDPDLFIRSLVYGHKYFRVEQIYCYARRSDLSRMTNKPYKYRRKLQHTMVWKSWKYLIAKNYNVAQLRFFCSENFYRLAVGQVLNENCLGGAITNWRRDAQALGLGWLQTSFGVITLVLIAHRYTAILAHVLRYIYIRIHRRNVPPAIPAV